MNGRSNADGDLEILHCLPSDEDLQIGFECQVTRGYIV